jgi:hypothetical protein
MKSKKSCRTCKNWLEKCPAFKYHSIEYMEDCVRDLTAMVGCASHSSAAGEAVLVLDEGIVLIQKRIDGIFEAYRGETNEKLTDRPYAAANGMGEAIKILIELRQQRERDR